MIFGSRNLKNLPLDSNGQRDWSFGLLSCCEDCNTCKYLESLRTWRRHLRSSPGCCACWCPCIVHAKNQRRLEHLNTRGYPDPRRHDSLVAGNLLYGVVDGLCHLGWILQVRISIQVSSTCISDTSNLFFIYYNTSSRMFWQAFFS